MDTQSNTAQPPVTPDIPSVNDLLDRVRKLAPLLRANSARAEAMRRVPDEVMEACRQAGLFKILQPARYGGYEHEPVVLFEVLFELARASSCIAWAVGLIIAHNWEIPLCDPRIAEDIWGADPDARLSSSYAAFGKAEAAEGGYRVSGTWPWSTGSDHCQWVLLGTRHINPDSPLGFDEKVMILPRADYEVDQDSWHMAGMQGTGSKDIVVRDAFVPAFRHHDVTAAFFADHRPGRDTFTARTYRYPFGIVFGWTLASVIVGAAAGAIDVYADAMKAKRHSYTGQEVKRDPFNQQRVAEATAMVHAAKAVMRSDFNEMSAFIDAGGKIPNEARVLYKWNLAYHAREAAEAVARMMKASGGGAFALSHDMQRFFRDTQTAGNHALLNADKAAAVYGWFVFSGQIEDFVL